MYRDEGTSKKKSRYTLLYVLEYKSAINHNHVPQLTYVIA